MFGRGVAAMSHLGARRPSSTTWCRSITASDWSQLDKLAGGFRPPRAFSIVDLSRATQHLTPAKRVINAGLTYDEVVARGAFLLANLMRLPKRLTEHPKVAEVTAAQYDRLSTMLASKRPELEEHLGAFDEQLAQFSGSMASLRRAIGAALAQSHGETAPTLSTQRRLDAQLDAIFSASIARGFLTRHYFASHTPRDGFSGLIQHRYAPAEQCANTIAKVEEEALRKHGRAPEFVVHAARHESDCTFVAEHVDSVLRELLVNACDATLRHHPPGQPLPPVRVIVATGDGSVNFKVADEGGGLPRSKLDDVWSYQPRVLNDEAGLGLPIARLYAKYFGGTLHLAPLEGFGTDCYASFTPRPDASCEALLRESASELHAPAGGATGEAQPGAGLFDAQSRRVHFFVTGEYRS